MTSANLGRAILELSTDDSKLEAGLHKSKGSLDAWGKAGVVAIGAVVAAFAAGAIKSIMSAADFEQTISGIKAVSGATTEEIKQLSGLALQLGKDTSFSASEAAMGIEELVKGGVSIADIMGGAATASLNLAAAGEIGLAEASEIAANAMNMFGLKGTDMAMVSDQIAGAANASSLSVLDFKLSLGAVGAVASLAGQDFQTTATAIALMGAAGIKGSDAGTSLKTMLMNLVPTTRTAKAAMAELGLTTADGSNKFLDAQGNFKSLKDISGELSLALAGLSESQKTAALEAIFGTDAIRAASVMAKAGAEGFDTMAASMGKVTAATVASEKLDNLKGSIEQMWGSLDTAAITLGIVFLPMIRKVVDAITGFINTLIPFIETHGPALMGSFESAGSAMQPFIEAVKRGIDILQDLRSVFQNLGTEAGFRTLWVVVKDAFEDGVKWLQGKVSTLESTLGQWAKAFGAWVGPMIPVLMAELGNVAVSIGNWIIAQMPNYLEKLSSWAKAFIEWIIPLIPPVLASLQALGEQILSWIVSQIPGLIDMIGKWATEFIAWVAPMIPPLLGELLTFASSMLDWIIAQAPSILETFLSTWVPAAIGWVAKAAFELLQELPAILVQLGWWIATEGAPKALNLFLELGVAIIKGIIGGIANMAGQLFAAIGNAVKSAFSSGMSAADAHSPSKLFMELGESLPLGMVEGIATHAGAVAEAIAALIQPDLVKGSIREIIEDAGLASVELNNFLTHMIDNLGYTAEAAVREIATVNAAIRDAAEATTKEAKDIRDSLAAILAPEPFIEDIREIVEDAGIASLEMAEYMDHLVTVVGLSVSEAIGKVRQVHQDMLDETEAAQEEAQKIIEEAQQKHQDQMTLIYKEAADIQREIAEQSVRDWSRNLQTETDIYNKALEDRAAAATAHLQAAADAQLRIIRNSNERAKKDNEKKRARKEQMQQNIAGLPEAKRLLQGQKLSHSLIDQVAAATGVAPRFIWDSMFGGWNPENVMETGPGTVVSGPGGRPIVVNLTNHGVMGINDAEAWVRSTVTEAGRRGTQD